MMIVDEKRPHTQASHPRDPWADWQPRWTVHKFTPHDLQEKHSPTAPRRSAADTDSGAGTARYSAADTGNRRLVDARLWEGMTFIQQDAAAEIAAAFDMMGRGMGYVTSNWQRIPGCTGMSNVSEAHGRMINLYITWGQKCAQQKISHAMAIDVLCFGFTCRMIDRDRRLKNGATRENLMRGLTLYCQLRGWG